MSKRVVTILAGVMLAVVGLVACSPGTPLVPDTLVTAIEADGRERTYDLAWQNTRLLVAVIDEGDFDEAEHVALELSARLHRLDKGEADTMSDRQTSATIDQVTSQATDRTRSENIHALDTAARSALQFFEEGVFDTAKNHALEAFVLARLLRTQQ